jgi:hypothetical protein
MSGYSFPNSEFNAFVFAPIGEERNGMLLSVMSALARRDIDPWEAARLTQLPKDRAIETIASVIEELPSEQWTPSDSKAIAARLVELLPSWNHSNTPSANPEEGIRTIVVMGLILTFLWGAALTFVGNGERPSGLNIPDIPITNVISPQRAPLRVGD